MRIDVKTADTAGKFKINQGVGFVCVPYNDGATFPLQAHLNGEPSRYELIDDERPLYPAAFQSVEFWGAVPQSTWLVWVAESAGEAFASQSSPRMQRIAYVDFPAASVVQAGQYWLTSSGTARTIPNLHDVRRFRGVHLIMAVGDFEPGPNTTATALTLAMDGFINSDASQQGANAGTPIYTSPATYTVADNFITGSTAGRIHLGETTETGSGTDWTSARERFPAVSPYLTLTGGTVEIATYLRAELWGIP